MRRTFRLRIRRKRPMVFAAFVALVSFLILRGCCKGPWRDPSLVLVTGYCNCGACCGWRMGGESNEVPVYAYGKMNGRPKKVGVTSSGTVARYGTIAADPRVYPFGTKIDIPGYGVGRVEDVGGAIKGRHIDVWFPTHEQARRWGARYLRLKVERK